MEKDTSHMEQLIYACFEHKGLVINDMCNTLAFEFDRRVFADVAYIKKFEKKAKVRFTGVVQPHDTCNGFRLLFYKL